MVSLTPLLADDPPAESGNERPALETRFQSLEEAHRQLAEQFDRLLRENESLQLQLRSITTQHTNLNDQYQLLSARLQGHSLAAFPQAPPQAEPVEQSPPLEIPAAQPPANEFYDNQPPDIRTDEPAPKPKDAATKSSFFEGFKWETQDGEYTVNLHSEIQVETRTYTLDTDPVNQFGFDVPRARIIFNGRLTKPIEYNVSFNKGLGTVDLLDAYLNFNYDPRFQFRIGRYRVPFTYDWYALNNQFLPTPERSVFAINQGYNRNVGAMIHGELLDERVDYALAAANGPRNSYVDNNADKDLMAYLNVRPFMQSECYDSLKHFNIGARSLGGFRTSFLSRRISAPPSMPRTTPARPTKSLPSWS
ncbi:MAG: porin [Planctomycetales bacterium]